MEFTPRQLQIMIYALIMLRFELEEDKADPLLPQSEFKKVKNNHRQCLILINKIKAEMDANNIVLDTEILANFDKALKKI